MVGNVILLINYFVRSLLHERRRIQIADPISHDLRAILILGELLIRPQDIVVECFQSLFKIRLLVTAWTFAGSEGNVDCLVVVG